MTIAGLGAHVSALVICCAVLSANATVADAQLSGRVVSGDSPVNEAQVELWSATTRIAQRVSGPDGTFRFSETERGSAIAILTRRIGFVPQRVRLDATTGEVEIHLTVLMTVLPQVQVSGSVIACPNSPSSNARAIWEKLRSRYADGTGLARGSEYLAWSGVVSRGHFGEIDLGHLKPGSRAMSATGIAMTQKLIEQLGYVWPAHTIGSGEDYGIWQYPPLEADYSQHFVESSFGARHSLSLLKDEGAGSTIAFCPADRKKSGLEGTLSIDADGDPVRAQWRYWNPTRQAEESGGEVSFAPRDPRSAAPVLLAANGMFWRRLRSGDYWERWQEYSGWTIQRGDSLLEQKR